MNRPPAFSFYVRDWFVDTADLDVDEEGAYIRLLAYSWVKPLPSEPAKLARIVRVNTRRWNKIWCSISNHFELTPDGSLENRRLEDERRKSQEYLALQSRKGKASGEVRRNRGSTAAQPEGQPNGNSSTATASTVVTTTAFPLPETRGTGTSLVLRELPTPAPRETAVRERTARRHVVEDGLKFAADVVFKYWRDRMGKNPLTTLLTPKRVAKISDRLRENGGDVSELLYVVDGCLKDDFYMGRSANSTTKYNGIENIFKDRDRVEKLRDLVPHESQHPYLDAP